MSSLPYITSPGNIDKALNAIKAAAVPDRVSQDFVKTILKIPGGSGAQITTYLKKINFATPNGEPTDIYTKFRNPKTSGQAVAQAIRHAYAPLYLRNEFMHELSDEDLLGLIIEETGQAHDSNPVKLTFSCIKYLKNHAKFDVKTEYIDATSNHHEEAGDIATSAPQRAPSQDSFGAGSRTGSVGLNLGYTINLNLPPTTDQAVFNAIFKSLKEHLLRDDDA